MDRYPLAALGSERGLVTTRGPPTAAAPTPRTATTSPAASLTAPSRATATPTALATTSRASRPESPGAASSLPAIAGRGTSAASRTEPPHPRARRARPNRTVTHSIWGSFTRCATLGVAHPGIAPSLAPVWGNPELPPRTLRSLRRDPQRSGSSLSQPLRESERLARDGDDDTVHVKQALVCASELRRSGSSHGVGGST